MQQRGYEYVFFVISGSRVLRINAYLERWIRWNWQTASRISARH